MNSGKKMRSLRKSVNLTQDEVARILGISTVTIQKWENGSRIRTNKLLDNVLTLYDTEPMDRIITIVSMYGSDKDIDYIKKREEIND